MLAYKKNWATLLAPLLHCTTVQHAQLQGMSHYGLVHHPSDGIKLVRKQGLRLYMDEGGGHRSLLAPYSDC